MARGYSDVLLDRAHPIFPDFLTHTFVSLLFYVHMVFITFYRPLILHPVTILCYDSIAFLSVLFGYGSTLQRLFPFRRRSRNPVSSIQNTTKNLILTPLSLTSYSPFPHPHLPPPVVPDSFTTSSSTRFAPFSYIPLPHLPLHPFVGK